jgi:basic membrane lipoprotein Med (substrate-binding protein (PBP1-ABC) superfamily)
MTTDQGPEQNGRAIALALVTAKVNGIFDPANTPMVGMTQAVIQRILALPQLCPGAHSDAGYS